MRIFRATLLLVFACLTAANGADSAMQKADSAVAKYRLALRMARSSVDTAKNEFLVRSACLGGCNKPGFFGGCAEEIKPSSFHMSVDMGSNRNPLRNSLGVADEKASRFSTSTGWMPDWLQTVNGISAEMDLLTGLASEIQAGSQDPENLLRIAQLRKAMRDTVADLARSKGLLADGIALVSTFLQTQTGSRESIGAAVIRGIQLAEARLAKARDDAHAWSCKSRLSEQLAEIKQAFMASAQTIPQTLDGSSRETEQAVAAVLGEMLTARSGHEPIMLQLTVLLEQDGSPSSFAQKLKLNTAANLWRKLATSAHRELVR